MFQVQQTIISDDVATFRFHCDLLQCKGGCCVSGDAGPPVERNEFPVLRKAWNLLAPGLRNRARQVVAADGLIQNGHRDPELSCTDGEECVFVTYESDGVAGCAIQKAWMQGRINWIKPLSCHLFPVRVIRSGRIDYLNLEYVPSLCVTGCEKGIADGVFLSDFLKHGFLRAYGESWYSEFLQACERVRKNKSVQAC